MCMSFRLSNIFAAVLITLLSVSTAAGNKRYPDFHGFINQGAIHTSDYNFFGDSDDSVSFDFSAITLGSYYKLTNTVDISAQVIHRRAGVTSSDGVQLDYGFVQLHPYRGGENDIKLKFGRIQNPLGLYNESRDIASTNPSILLPQSAYYDSLYTLFHSSDSANVSWSNYSKGHITSVSLNVGKPLLNDHAEGILTFDVTEGQTENEQIIIGKLQVESPSKGTTFALSGFNFEFETQHPVLFPTGSDVSVNAWFLSAQKDFGKSELTAEYGRFMFKYYDFNRSIGRFNPNTEFYYAQYLYRLNEKLSVLGRYDALFTERSDRSGRETATLFRSQRVNYFAKDITIGVRYKPFDNWILSAEHHRIKGFAWSPHANTEPRPNDDGHWVIKPP